MKFDPVFKSINYKLATLDDCLVSLNLVKTSSLDFVKNASDKNLYLFQIELTQLVTDEIYNEEFLATLRDELKSLEDKNIYIIIDLIDNQNDLSDKSLDSEEVEFYLESFKHLTRRIKDCTSLIGLYLNESFAKNEIEAKINSLIESQNKKHSHYLYFLSGEAKVDFSLIEDEYKDKIVLV